MFQSKKPYSAVTVTIENLTAESYPEDDLSGIPDLVEVIKMQATGPAEAARAIRKKLKYGTAHRQIRALVLLDGLIHNAGPGFQRALADEPLLERLRVCATSGLSDPAVRKKCAELFREWAQYASVPGMERVARLHRELPKRKVAMTQERSRVVRETENPFGDDEEDDEDNDDDEDEKDEGKAPLPRQKQQQPVVGPSSSAETSVAPSSKKSASSKSKLKSKGKRKGKSKNRRPFNLDLEKDKMKSVIAEASMASTGLMNSLQTINRERERVSENRVASGHFEACKTLRRRILRYIHQVESEEWLGSLLHANDELVHALMAFEQLDQSIEADSDSDDELAEQAHRYRMITEKAQRDRTGGCSPDAGSPGAGDALAPAKPPRPAVPARRQVPAVVSRRKEEEEEEVDAEDDDDNPFGDKNVISTPGIERGEPRW